ncbi:MAG: hypothetical protein VCB59_05215 [Gammaproteobacteria bacterium]
MTLVAPTGYTISYEEHVNIETTNGFAVAGGSLVAGGITNNLLSVIAGSGTAFQTWNIGPVFVPINNKQTIDVSFTNSLVASRFGGLGDIARVEKSSAILTVGLTAVPLPGALWLFSVPFAGLITISRTSRR